MKTLEGGCSVPVAVNSKVPKFPPILCSHLHFSDYWQLLLWYYPLLGFGQWLGATWWCLEPRWGHLHHGHWEGISHICIDWCNYFVILTLTTSATGHFLWWWWPGSDPFQTILSVQHCEYLFFHSCRAISQNRSHTDVKTHAESVWVCQQKTPLLLRTSFLAIDTCNFIQTALEYPSC